MPKQCVVSGCSSQDSCKNLKFHRIPANPARRSLWISAINRTYVSGAEVGNLWQPKDEGARVCSRHFITGKSDDPLHPDYVPSLDMGYSTKTESVSDQRVNRYQRSLDRCLAKKQELDHYEASTSVKEPLQDISNSNTVFSESIITTQKYTEEIRQLKEEINDLRASIQKIHLTYSPKLIENGIEFIKNDNARTKFFTGLPSFEVFNWLNEYVKLSLPHSDVLSSGDVLLLILMRIRLNCHNQDLAYRFHISIGLVSKLVNQGIPELAQKLKFLIRWPQKEDIIRSMPSCFKECYKFCTSIIDCTEIFIETPSNFTMRSATYSSYKHHHTIKYLVCMAPSGAISFLSKAYGGRTSDKIITIKSGFLNLLNHGDQVLADRGFLIQDEVMSRGATLIIPSFSKGKPQLSAREVETSRQISHVRIHVERIMDRLKSFKFFSSRLPLYMVQHSDNVMTICAAIVNLHPPIIN